MPLSANSRRWLRQTFWTALAAVLTVTGLNLWMTSRASDRIFTDATKVSAAPVALVLGTAEKIGNYTNVHFRVRMDAAALLYKAGKVKHLLLSGDNSRPGYDEPGDMKAALIARGVPAEAMTCDYAGFRTLDSIVRAKEIFGVTECVIISDDFHLARALWLADHHDVKATAFYSDAVGWRTSFNSRSREWLARVLALMDGITGTRPKFGGEKVTLPIQP